MTGKRLALAIARARGVHPPRGLSRLESAGLAIVHAPAPPDVATPSTEQVQGFAAEVDRIHRDETVLPLRYGWVVESEAELEAILDGHHEEWHAALDAVEGCEEMGLRVLLQPPSAEVSPPMVGATSDRPGTAYLAALRHRAAGSEALAREAALLSGFIRETLAGVCRRSVVELPGVGRERLLSFGFLVPRTEMDAFLALVKTLDHEVKGRVLLTGPWPPYSFVGAGLGRDTQR